MLSSLPLRCHWTETINNVCHGKDIGEEDCQKAGKLNIFLEQKMSGICDACHNEKRHNLEYNEAAIDLGNNMPVRNPHPPKDSELRVNRYSGRWAPRGRMVELV